MQVTLKKVLKLSYFYFLIMNNVISLKSLISVWWCLCFWYNWLDTVIYICLRHFAIFSSKDIVVLYLCCLSPNSLILLIDAIREQSIFMGIRDRAICNGTACYFDPSFERGHRLFWRLALRGHGLFQCRISTGQRLFWCTAVRDHFII